MIALWRRVWDVPIGRLDPVDAFLVGLSFSVLPWIMALALILLAACGHVEVIQPPNTATACDRALQCRTIEPGQQDACVACLEHIDQAKLDQLRAEYGDLPPLDTVDCATITRVVQVGTNLGACIVGRWYGP